MIRQNRVMWQGSIVMAVSVRPIHTTKLHTSVASYLRVVRGRSTVHFRRRSHTLCTSGFLDDVMFVHSQPGKSDAISASTRSDSPKRSTGPEA